MIVNIGCNNVNVTVARVTGGYPIVPEVRFGFSVEAPHPLHIACPRRSESVDHMPECGDIFSGILPIMGKRPGIPVDFEFMEYPHDHVTIVGSYLSRKSINVS